MLEKTILIVDDERRMADSLRDLFVLEGYQCAAAYGGSAGMEMLRRQAYHVVITDLRMPEVDGLDLIRFVHEHAPRTLVIVATAHASTESAIEAIHCGVMEYLRKPFDFDSLLKVVARAFARLETEQLREDTAAMITHDIKIPLTSIIGFASMIYDRGRKEFHPRAREFVGAIQANGQKIQAMIENYLTTCKIEAGTLQITKVTVDLRQMLQDVLENARLLAERRGREIELEIGDIPETLNVDEPLIYRAVCNLLQNAIKYSTEGEPIRMKAGRVAAEDSPTGSEGVCIETLNRAELASPDALDGIFERYRRSGQATRIEGSGLGLYVVQAIIKAHGGDVTAELLEGGMVRFAIYLPCPV